MYQITAHRKGTHTDRYLDYDSHHPLSHKKSVASTLMNRAHTHSSRTSSRNKEVRHVGNALRMNGYPSRLTVDPRRASGHSQILPISDHPMESVNYHPIHQRSYRIHQEDLIPPGHPSMLQTIPDP